MSGSIDIIKFMFNKEPSLKKEVKGLLQETPLTKKQKKTAYQKALEEASMSWKKPIIL